MHEIKNISDMSHELTYHRYMLSQGQVKNLFKDISVAEYITLHRTSHSISEKTDGSSKTYLKDVAQALHFSISGASKVIGGLRDKGLVSWSHDGDGSEGTYITITADGTRLMERQEGLLREYYGKVIEKFGQENMANMLQLMVRFEAVMDEELKEFGEDTDEV